MSSADYVVVGAGSAGCVVAARLAELPDARVVVLEAGPAGTLEAIHPPPLWPAPGGPGVGGHGGRRALRDGAAAGERRARPPVAARQGARRLEQPQRHGLP